MMYVAYQPEQGTRNNHRYNHCPMLHCSATALFQNLLRQLQLAKDLRRLSVGRIAYSSGLT